MAYCQTSKRIMSTIAVLHLALLLSNIPYALAGQDTEMDRLYTDMFLNYNHKTLPVLNATEPVVIEISAYIVNVNNFNELYGELSLTLAFAMGWTEKRISWNVSDYGGISEMAVYTEDIWRPRMFLLQASEKVAEVCNALIQPVIFYNGYVMWTSTRVLKVSCSVNVEKFPFDTQSCEMVLLNWSHRRSTLLLYPQHAYVQTLYYSENSQWALKPSLVEICEGYDTAPCLNMTIVLKRRSEFFMFYIIIPLLFLGLINNLVFIMPPTSGERTSVAVTTFLSFVVYMNMVNDVVPQSSRPMALMYFYITALLIYSSTIMFLCIVSLRIYDRTNAVPIRLQIAVWIAGFHFVRSTKKNSDPFPKNNKHDAIGLVDRHGDQITVEESNKKNQIEGDDDVPQQQQLGNSPPGWICSWNSVGKTFDLYCFVLLYIALATASSLMASHWMVAY